MEIMEERIRWTANAYYNRGLQKAGIRDLTGAAADLKRALRFNKYQTDARNLLGLIYYEVGEVGSALVQWIISLNLEPEDNLCAEYLDYVRSQQGFLDMADQSAKKFNQALSCAMTGNEDLAILLLTRMVEDYPQYVKAQELLALLYIHGEDYTKAGKCLMDAQKVDCYNPQVEYYMDITKRNTSRAEVEEKKLKNAFSHHQMQDDDIILPPSYRENTGWQSVLNILAGLLIGVVVAVFLILPANRNYLNRRHNEELRSNLELLNERNLEIDGLQADIQAATTQRDNAEQQLSLYMDDTDGLINQYRNLIEILDDIQEEHLTAAALLYSETNWPLLQREEGLDDVLSGIYEVMYDTGYQLLENEGDSALDAEDWAAAADLYLKSLSIKDDNISAMYKLGLAFKGAGDDETANIYFGDIIMNHPDSDYAEMAREQRGY